MFILYFYLIFQMFVLDGSTFLHSHMIYINKIELNKWLFHYFLLRTLRLFFFGLVAFSFLMIESKLIAAFGALVLTLGDESRTTGAS